VSPPNFGHSLKRNGPTFNPVHGGGFDELDVAAGLANAVRFEPAELELEDDVAVQAAVVEERRVSASP
jgi:hypothetical protein